MRVRPIPPPKIEAEEEHGEMVRRSMEEMVNEVLDAMAEEAFRQAPRFNPPGPVLPPDFPPLPAFPRPNPHEAPVPVRAFATEAMTQGMVAAEGRFSPASVEQLLTRYASDQVRKAIKNKGRGIDYSSGTLRAVGAAGAVAGGGFLFNFVQKMRLRGGGAPFLSGGGGGFGSGGQG